MAPGAPAEWLVDATEESGLDFVHSTGGTGELYLPEIMGGGVAVFDADGDGRLDLYFANQNDLLPDHAVSTTRLNGFYRQVDAGRFADATRASGLGDGGYGNGVAIGDVDNDGDPDVYLTNLGPDRLYLNDGSGVFAESPASTDMAVDDLSVSAAFFDFDRDDDLDLYVTRYVRWDAATRCSATSGRPTYCGPRAFPPASDRLLRNEGGGRFVDVSSEAGIATTYAAGLGVLVEDFDDDGWPDVYVANDAYANNLWINQRDGTFLDAALELGAAYNELGQPEAGMGLVADDLDNDGLTDLFVTHLDQETNTLYRTLPGGVGFTDASTASSLGRPSWHLTGFGVAALDIELDGDLDLAIGNGRVTLADKAPPGALAEPWNRLAEPNLLFLNRGDGTFEPAGRIAPDFVDTVEITRGVVAADLEGDGDLDLVVANIEGRARIYRNEAPRQGEWLAIVATEPALGRAAIGARITVEHSEGTTRRTLSRSTSYASSAPAAAHVRLPTDGAYARILVRWPDGTEEVFPGGVGGRRLSLRRGEGRLGGGTPSAETPAAMTPAAGATTDTTSHPGEEMPHGGEVG